MVRTWEVYVIMKCLCLYYRFVKAIGVWRLLFRAL